MSTLSQLLPFLVIKKVQRKLAVLPFERVAWKMVRKGVLMASGVRGGEERPGGPKSKETLGLFRFIVCGFVICRKDLIDSFINTHRQAFKY